MADRRLLLRTLRKILKSFGVSENKSRGSGSHTLFFKAFDDGEFSYPVPTHDKEIAKVYVKGARKAFRLTPDHDVSDDAFYGAS